MNLRRSNTITLCLAILLMMMATLPLTGCGVLPRGNAKTVTPVPPTVHPRGLAFDKEISLVVEQERKDLLITNLEPRTLTDFQLWLNQQYVAVIKEVKVGQTIRVPLGSFRNQHNETFPLGSFLAIDKRGRVVQAELITTSLKSPTRHRVQTRAPSP